MQGTIQPTSATYKVSPQLWAVVSVVFMGEEKLFLSYKN